MSEELELEALEIEGAASEPVLAVSRRLEDLTVEELMALAPKPVRPAFMKGPHSPVSKEDFEKLKEDAEKPEEAPAPPEALATEDATTADEDVEAAEIEAPEGEQVAGPEAAAPSPCGTFEGIPQTGWRPPDPTMAVGPDDVLLAVNTDLAGYDKTGTLRFRWPNMTSLFNPVMPVDAKLFDPVLAYDHYARRWVVVIAARRDSPRGSWFLVAVSQGDSPRGPYWLWALDASLDGSTPTDNWADYPMLGFDTQCIYIAANMFAGDLFQYDKLRILSKPELYAGGAIRWYDWWNFRNPDNSLAFSIQPCDHFRGTGGNPPAYLINALWPDGDSLTMWTLHNPAAHWRGGSSSWARDRVACRKYEFPPDGRQPDTSVRIETNDTRLLTALYQYVGGLRRVWTAHTSKHTWSNESEARSVVQWYEIDVGSKSVVQQNRYGAPGKYYFFPAIQTDLACNAYVVFGRSGASEYGQLRYTGRRVGAPAGDLENSRLIKAGESSYTGQRWGDYFGVCRDAGDSSKVWMYGQYAEADNAWGTWAACATYR